MAWVEGSHERSFEVNAPKEEVAAFMADPSRFRPCMLSVEKAEEVDGQTYRWTLEEIGALNVTFQGDYTVRYERDGDVVTWSTIDVDTNNMRSEGRAEFEALSESRTRVKYKETIASDLPVPKLMVKPFRPIAAREVKKGIDGFLDAVIEHVNSGRHRAPEGA